jgi:hypothetical protein
MRGAGVIMVPAGITASLHLYFRPMFGPHSAAE